jgi:hypothetical protein
MTGVLNINSNKITNLANPTVAQDAATKTYVDTQDGLRVAKAGDTMTGILNMGAYRITSLADPTAAQDAATRAYTNAQDGLRVAKAGDTMTGVLNMNSNKITNLVDPVSVQDAATKAYVDRFQSFQYKTATGTIPATLNTNLTLFTFPTGKSPLNGKIIIQELWLERINGEWFSSGNYIDYAWGTFLKMITSTDLQVRYTATPIGWARRFRLDYVEMP